MAAASSSPISSGIGIILEALTATWLHWPPVGIAATTLCPTSNSVTPEPSECMTPLTSYPGVNGNGGLG